MSNGHSVLDSITNAFVPIHRDGYKFRLAAIATAWWLYFFRDPDRVIPARKGLVVSAADGKIVGAADVVAPRELEFGGEKRTRISVFLSIFDVHIVRAPVAGRVVRSHYVPGAFLNAELDKG